MHENIQICCVNGVNSELSSNYLRLADDAGAETGKQQNKPMRKIGERL